MYDKSAAGSSGRKVSFGNRAFESILLVIGSAIGGLAGSLLPINSEGIDFAMTALFVVIFIEQWMEKKNRIPAVIGVVGAFVCLQIFGADSFVLPSMLLIVLILFVGKKRLDKEEGRCR